MQETFRLVKGVRSVGFLIVAFCLALCAVYASLLFIDDPFAEGRSGVGIGVLGLCVFTPMLAMSCSVLASYYTDRFSIEGKSLSVHSNFQNRQFEIADIEILRWIANSSGGCVLFRIEGTESRLKLAGRSRDDRLRIIRFLRSNVPADVQVGWPMFCYKIALTQRDGFRIERFDRSRTPFGVTQRRYNLMLAVAVPVSAIISLVLANQFQLRQFLVLPIMAVVAFAVFRKLALKPMDEALAEASAAAWLEGEANTPAGHS